MIPGLDFKTELEIEDNADSLTEKEWNKISFHLYNLSSGFIEKFHEKIKWSSVASNSKNSLSLIMEYKDRFDSNVLFIVAKMCFQAHFGLTGSKPYAEELEEIEEEPELVIRAHRLFTLIDKSKK